MGVMLRAKSFSFQFAHSSIRRGHKMDVTKGQTARCHPVSSHRAVDAARAYSGARPEVPTGRPPSPGYFRAADIRAVIESPQ